MNTSNTLHTQGPTLPISVELHALKYRQPNETFREAMSRIADHLKDSPEHYNAFRDTLLDMRFLPAGRVQAASGAARQVTPYNCFVSQTIPDSMKGIMDAATRAAETMRLGGGIGYDFSTLRPRGDNITSISSASSGPVSFMHIFDAVCGTVASAGHRRGAQMAVLRVDHPDIEEFIKCKQPSKALRPLFDYVESMAPDNPLRTTLWTSLQKALPLTNFNISVGVTDAFMEALKTDTPFPLVFEGKIYKYISPKALWNEIMRSTWDYAEPGVLFIDTMNTMNNLWYCETLAATNPCAEQPLPPNGACLLGSFNLVKYIKAVANCVEASDACSVVDDCHLCLKDYYFDYDLLAADIPHVVRAMDNIVDRAIYPLPEQEAEAKSKRRMGLGVTGVANALEILGFTYGSPEFLEELEGILRFLAVQIYSTSMDLAKEKGAFPAYEYAHYKESKFLKNIDAPWYFDNQGLLEKLKTHGIRNSHLLSIAPTGTISVTADNVSSGIEPVYALSATRTINTPDGVRNVIVEDYAYREYGIKGKTADQCTPDEHLNVLLLASQYVDSAVSKTCNIGSEVSFEDFKSLYIKAYEGGAKGCTTFRAAGKRMGILNANPAEKDEGGAACFIDPETGVRTCDT